MAEKWFLVVALLCMHVFLIPADNKPKNTIPLHCSIPKLLPHSKIEDIQNCIEFLAYLHVYKPGQALSGNHEETQHIAEAVELLTKSGLAFQVWKERVSEVVNILREKNKIIAASYQAYIGGRCAKNEYDRLWIKEPKGRMLSQALLSNGMVVEQFEAYKVLVPKVVQVVTKKGRSVAHKVVLAEQKADFVENLRIGNHSLSKTFYNRNGESIHQLRFVIQKD